MARVITRNHAEAIAKKLKAVYRKASAHTIAEIYEDGMLIADFGIRRGSNKEQGHDHVQKDLHVTSRDAKLLAQCPLTREAWLDLLRDKGLL
jgi:hypothetical protein